MSMQLFYSAEEITSAPPARRLGIGNHRGVIIQNRSPWWLAVIDGTNLAQTIPAWFMAGFSVSRQSPSLIVLPATDARGNTIQDFDVPGMTHGVWVDTECIVDQPFMRPLVIASVPLKATGTQVQSAVQADAYASPDGGTTWQPVSPSNPLFTELTGSYVGSPLADGAALPASIILGELAGLGYNESTFDRWRNNTQGTLLASATRNTTTYSPDQINYNSRGVHVILNVTAASGTGGLQIVIHGKDPVSLIYYELNPTPTAITATGLYIYELYPGASSPAPGSTNQWVVQRTAASLPRIWRVGIAHGDATNYTYSVAFELII